MVGSPETCMVVVVGVEELLRYSAWIAVVFRAQSWDCIVTRWLWMVGLYGIYGDDELGC